LGQASSVKVIRHGAVWTLVRRPPSGKPIRKEKEDSVWTLVTTPALNRPHVPSCGVVGLPPGQHKVLIELVNPEHHVFTACTTCRQMVTFTVSGPTK